MQSSLLCSLAGQHAMPTLESTVVSPVLKLFSFMILQIALYVIKTLQR